MTVFNPIPIFRFTNSILSGYRNFRPNPLQWTSSATYAQSAEERLGIDKPKRPLTPFFKFAGQIRPNLVAKNPEASVTDIMKMVSKHWEQLGQDAKEKLNSEYIKDKDAYKKAMSSFETSLSEEQKLDIRKMKEAIAEAKTKRRVKAEIKQLGKPKKPVSSFILFSQSEKNTMTDKGVVNFQIMMAEKWRKMSPEEKAVWEKKAQELQNNYKKDIAQWEQKMVRMGNIDYVRNKALIEEGKKTNKVKPQ